MTQVPRNSPDPPPARPAREVDIRDYAALWDLFLWGRAVSKNDEEFLSNISSRLQSMSSAERSRFLRCCGEFFTKAADANDTREGEV